MDIRRDNNTTIKILYMASEAEPFIKVGGLGDVAGSLPRELRAVKSYKDREVLLDTRLVLPYHEAIKNKAINAEKIASFNIPYRDTLLPVQVFYTDYAGFPVYLIDGDKIPANSSVYSMDQNIDAEKYFFFTYAAVLMTQQLNWRPDIVHSNDWHTALAPLIVKHLKNTGQIDPKTKTLLTIHNLPFFGASVQHLLKEYGINYTPDFLQPDWSRYLPLPIGLSAAEKINAVSNTYAQEILTPEFGCGMEGYLQSIQGKITGIINGIDYAQWDPAIDELITAKYSSASLADKQKNKSALLDMLGFDQSSLDKPLLAIIGRLDYQKGIDIAIAGLRSAAILPWNLVILGTGSSQLEHEIKDFASAYPDRVRAVLKFDVPLSHHIYAGADMLLMPSRYEPCGLAQMIAMKYGTLPVARSAGGLKDTIIPAAKSVTGNGFLFDDPSSNSLVESLTYAIQVYSRQTEWVKILLAAMSADFSWAQSAQKYTGTYLDLLEE